MKALGILKDIKNNNPFIYGFSHIRVRILASNEQSRIDEAIAELEEMQQPKSCEEHGAEINLRIGNRYVSKKFTETEVNSLILFEQYFKDTFENMLEMLKEQ